MTLRLTLLTVLCALSLFSVAQNNLPLFNSGDIIQTGIKLYDDSKYKEALKEFQKIPKGDTNYVLSLYESALTCAADSQYALGIAYCEKALSLKTDRERCPEILVQYASLLDYAGQQKRALHVFDSALAVYPAYIGLHINKGTTLLRMKNYAEAEKVFQQALLINPYSASAHFKLGLSALNQGKIIPAFLSMMANLAIEPEGRFSRNSISVMTEIAKSKDEVTEAVNKRKEEPSDNYRLTEQIVLSKIALDKNYKIIIGLDDPISRQMQVVFEKLAYDETDKDFWMQFYIPLYKKIFDDKKFEYFVNYVFSGVDVASIKDFNKKKKKEIEALKSDMVEYLNMIRATRELQVSKRNCTGPCYLFSESSLIGKGVANSDRSMITGPWEFYYPAGNKKGAGLFNAKGEKEGLFTYYYFNGQIKGKELYSNGKQDGEETYYYDQGVVASRSTYKNGQALQQTAYYEEGAVKTIATFSNGNLNGVKKSLYESGIVQAEETYADDKRNGLFKTYYTNGQLESEGNYTDDLLNGPYKSWYSDGTLSVEATYNQDKLTGTLKRYTENGKVKSVENYTNGVLEGEYVSYHENGQVHTRYMNKKGKTTGDVEYFAKDGKLYSTLTFSGDIIKAGRYFDKTGKQIGLSEMAKGKLDLLTLNADGTKNTLTTYNSKGEVEGPKTYYFGSGKERALEVYTKGGLNGESVAYYPNGQKRYSIPYSDNQKNGYYTSWFLHGVKQEEGWYGYDQLQGEWLEYDELGTLSDRSWFINGKRNGVKTSYWPNGKKQSDYLYEIDKLQEVTEYDTTGRTINVVKLNNGSGKFVSLYATGKIYSEYLFVNGNINGQYKSYYFDGSLLTVQHYKHGLLDSSYTSYYFGGKIRVEGKYKLNEKTGIWKYYRTDGTVYTTEEYKAGKLHGKNIFFFKDGKIDTEILMQNGEREGLYKRYAEDGELLYQLRYEEGVPAGYSYLDKNRVLVPEIPFVQGNGKLKALYANGNPSATMEYVDGVQHGPYTLYHPNGKVTVNDTEVYGATEGQRNEYYIDGKPRSVYTYLHDNYHGPYKEYNAKGIVVEEGNFYNDALHGEQRWYDENGKLKQVRYYYYGQLLEAK